MSYKSYWESNINLWGEFYLDISHGHEKLNGPKWFVWIYVRTISRIERNLMQRRYKLTVEFLDEFVKPGENFLDLGCGTGIFTSYALSLGANVTAVDFAENAIYETRRRVTKSFPGRNLYPGNFSLIKADISSQIFSSHETCIVVGVLPYINDIRWIFSNTISKQKVSLIQYVDSKNIFNLLRKSLKFLNVRKLQMISPLLINSLCDEFNLKVIRRLKIGTGYMDIIVKNDPN